MSKTPEYTFHWEPPYMERPPENIPDRLVTPEKTIHLVPNEDRFVPYLEKIIEPLNENMTRESFDQSLYNCLPLMFGNQHGFIIKALYDITLRWNGGHGTDSLTIQTSGTPEEQEIQRVWSIAGRGIVHIQNSFIVRTPKNVNTMVMTPPNYPVDGVSWMHAVVETDQARRDFPITFWITRPDQDIVFKKGTPLGCILPYPRYFLDGYKLEVLQDPSLLEDYRKTNAYMGELQRKMEGKPNYTYLMGEDIYGNRFEHHQKTLDGGSTWQHYLKKSGSEKD